MNIPAAAFVVVSLFVIGAPAHAQERSSAIRPPLVEVGGGIGAAGPFGSGAPVFLPATRVSFNLTPQFAVKIGADFAAGEYVHGLQGIYSVQIQQFLGDPVRRTRAFLTYGISGYFELRRIPAWHYTMPAGDVVAYPAHWTGSVSAPIAPLAGAGVRHRAASHLYVDVGGQLWMVPDGGVAWVAQLAFVVPIGHGR